MRRSTIYGETKTTLSRLFKWKKRHENWGKKKKKPISDGQYIETDLLSSGVGVVMRMLSHYMGNMSAPLTLAHFVPFHPIPTPGLDDASSGLATNDRLFSIGRQRAPALRASVRSSAVQ